VRPGVPAAADAARTLRFLLMVAILSRSTADWPFRGKRPIAGPLPALSALVTVARPCGFAVQFVEAHLGPNRVLLLPIHFTGARAHLRVAGQAV
jgi:hypothetical protein